MAKKNHHFFASCALGWQTADTRDEAIEGLVKRFRSDFKKMAANTIANNERGAYIWSCRVNVANDIKYKIAYYSPDGVETQDYKESYVTRVTAKTVNFWTIVQAD